MSGYDIGRFLERTVSHFWSESYGQIYPTLKALESEGLIRGRDDEADGRGRRSYRLTDEGLVALRSWLTEPPEPEVPRYEMSLKLFFADQLPVERTLEHLRAHRARHAGMLEEYRHQEAGLEGRLAGSLRLPYWLAVLRGGIRYAETVVTWCDETIRSLESLDPAEYPAPPSAPVDPE